MGKVNKPSEIGTYKLYAYVIMDNHIHLLIKEDRENISEIITLL